MLLPYHVDVPMQRWPVVNWIIIAVTLLTSLYISVALATGGISIEAVDTLVLGGGSLWSWPGYMLVHGGGWHLFGNMLFLFLFGNAICAKVGNLAFALIYVGLGLFAGAVHMLFDGTPVIGASGAINGVVGMFAVLYPFNSVSCLFFIWFIPRRVVISSIWVILLWFVFDILGAVAGGGGVAHFAHIGGLLGGVALALVLLVTGAITAGEYEKTLPEALGVELPELDIKRALKRLLHGKAAAARPERDIGAGTDREEAGREGGKGPPEPAGAGTDYIAFLCRCGKAYKAPRTAAGRVTRCRGCGARLRVPGPE